MGDSSYKGVSAAQDSRFSNKESALLRKLKFPPHFDVKVDMRKVELSVLKPWIARRVTELLGFEDDVVLEYATGMLEGERFPDPKKVQIQLMGFLESSTAEFMSELWELLVSAQESPGGVPKRFVEEKKEELRRKREEGERVVREARERAQRAAESAGDNGRKKSRWDAGAPTTSSSAAPVGSEMRPRAQGNGRERDFPHQRDDPTRSEWNRRRDIFRDRNGNTTDRSRDSGWGSRASAASHHQQGDSYRPSSRRSPSPPPRRRRSPSPPPRPRSRSRSVTPDYRDKISKRPTRNHDRDARDRHIRRPQNDRPHEKTRDHGSTRRAEGEAEDAYERDAQRAAARARSLSPSDSGSGASKADLGDEREDRSFKPADAGRDDADTEAQRERELRAKLLRAKTLRLTKRQ